MYKSYVGLDILHNRDKAQETSVMSAIVNLFGDLRCQRVLWYGASPEPEAFTWVTINVLKLASENALFWINFIFLK